MHVYICTHTHMYIWYTTISFNTVISDTIIPILQMEEIETRGLSLSYEASERQLRPTRKVSIQCSFHAVTLPLQISFFLFSFLLW